MHPKKTKKRELTQDHFVNDRKLDRILLKNKHGLVCYHAQQPTSVVENDPKDSRNIVDSQNPLEIAWEVAKSH